jgi:sialidase-1
MLMHDRWIMLGVVAAMVGVMPVPAPAQQAAPPARHPEFEMRVLFSGGRVRIPKITVTTNDTVIAFARNGELMRRSTDAGQTWGVTNNMASGGGNVIVDENTGDVMMLYPSKGFMQRSRDDGKTWERESIVVKPNGLGQGTSNNVPIDVLCSESGITLKHGKHKGRLLMPGRCMPPDGGRDQKHWPYHYNTAIYSDDGGKIWQTAYPVQTGTGEGTLAELSDGRIYYNSRSHLSVDNRRRIAWSHDGGNMWTDWQVSEYLFEVGQPFYFRYGTKPSYGCNAGLVRMPLEATGGKDVLLFSTPDNPGKSRIRMTVWASFDGAKTWPVKRLVHETHSAYSSLAADKKGKIYCLFEREGTVSVARFNLEWLTQRQDWQSLFPDGETK